MSPHHDLILQRLDRMDDRMFTLGDVLDVKASIVLVIVTFLATQTGGWLAESGSALARALLVGSAIALAAAGTLAFGALWPREFETETAEAWAGWIGELEDHYRRDPEADAKVALELRRGQIKRTKERIETNAGHVAHKSRWLFWSFGATAAALALNLLTLLLRGVQAPFFSSVLGGGGGG